MFSRRSLLILVTELSLGKDSLSHKNRLYSYFCNFLSLVRGNDGKFSDDDLARILQGATSNAASPFRARGTPASLRLVEIMGMEQARAWGLCTMNEFRKYLGLKRASFFVWTWIVN